MDSRHSDGSLARHEEGELKEMLRVAEEEIEKPDIESVMVRKRKRGNQASKLQKLQKDLRP